MAALSAVEQALDIMESAGRPVHELLGAPAATASAYAYVAGPSHANPVDGARR
jgi:L-alanine-DL-glutamate epimerase-like enolase superfamily enzyme